MDLRHEKSWTYDSKVWDFDSKNQGLMTQKPGTYDSKNQGLMTQKSGTYDSKTRDLRHESAIVTARNIILMERNIVFNMIITQKSFIFNDKLNIPFTYFDR